MCPTHPPLNSTPQGAMGKKVSIAEAALEIGSLISLR